MGLGEIIAAARRGLGLSQKALANLLLQDNGKPPSQQLIAAIETDCKNIGSEALLNQLATILGINPFILYFYSCSIPSKWCATTTLGTDKIELAYETMQSLLFSTDNR